MSLYYEVKITGGTSEGPYSVYYDAINPTNYATNYYTGLPLTGVTYSDLISGIVAQVPDSSVSIYVQNNKVGCSNSQLFYIVEPTPTPTNTQTTTPTNTVTPTQTRTPTPTPVPYVLNARYVLGSYCPYVKNVTNISLQTGGITACRVLPAALSTSSCNGSTFASKQIFVSSGCDRSSLTFQRSISRSGSCSSNCIWTLNYYDIRINRNGSPFFSTTVNYPTPFALTTTARTHSYTYTLPAGTLIEPGDTWTFTWTDFGQPG